MYDDYDDYLDELDDELDSYQDEIDDYDDELSRLEDEESFLDVMYGMQTDEDDKTYYDIRKAHLRGEQEPSFIKRAITTAAIYHFFRKLFG